MTPLGQTQQHMMACLLADDLSLPAGWTQRHRAGLEIYRNNFRAATLEALTNAFERTCRLVGEASFTRAAIHHIITCPPHTWTLDDVGEGFAATCAALFAQDPEVAQLAWLEWAMHRAFSAQNSQPMTGVAFAAATATYTGTAWCDMRLKVAPSVAVAVTAYDLADLWQATAATETSRQNPALEESLAVIVWREGERPVFRLAPDYEFTALRTMMAGGSYGAACDAVVAALDETTAAAAAGAMLSRWLGDGLIEAIGP